MSSGGPPIVSSDKRDSQDPAHLEAVRRTRAACYKDRLNLLVAHDKRRGRRRNKRKSVRDDAVDVSDSPQKPTLVSFLPFMRRIAEIDAVTMTSLPDIMVCLHWKDDRLFEWDAATEDYTWNKSVFAAADLDPKDYLNTWKKGPVWVPDCRMRFNSGDRHDAGPEADFVEVDILKKDNGFPHVVMYMSFNLLIDHSFVLKMFPFDYQVLTYRFELFNQDAYTGAIFIPHDPSMMHSACDMFSSWADHEADGYDVVDARIVPIIAEDESVYGLSLYGVSTEGDKVVLKAGGSLLNSSIEIRVLVDRASGFFVKKVLSIVVLLVLMAAMIFLMKRNSDGLSDRLAVVVTLLLTVVSLQHSLAAYVPVLPYLTTMDMVINTMYLGYAFAFAENCAIYMLVVTNAPDEDDDEGDRRRRRLARADGDDDEMSEADQTLRRQQFLDIASRMDLVCLFIYCAGILALLGYIFARYKFRSFPAAYTHWPEKTLRFVPERLMEAMDKDTLAKLEKIPHSEQDARFLTDAEYQVRMADPELFLQTAINESYRMEDEFFHGVVSPPPGALVDSPPTVVMLNPAALKSNRPSSQMSPATEGDQTNPRRRSVKAKLSPVEGGYHAA